MSRGKAVMRNIIGVVLFLLLFILALWFIQKHNQTRAPQPSAAMVSLSQRTKESGCITQGPLPDKACTPGAVFPEASVKEICVSGYTKRVRNVPIDLKREVYSEYGVKHRVKGEYEVDHLIPLELGGSNDIANLWPEPAEPQPGFHEKDKVENYLHEQVCSGRMELRTAQSVIENDWLSVYKRMN